MHNTHKGPVSKDLPKNSLAIVLDVLHLNDEDKSMESWKTQTVPITDNECHNMQT